MVLKKNRCIAIVTGTRAEYGLLAPTMRLIADDPALTLRTVVTGTHLTPAFGGTVAEIKADGFTINASVPLDLVKTTEVDIAVAMGDATSGLARELEQLAPDIVVVLGDRWEILAAASACTVLRLPLAHVHGGEVTTGAMDDGIRHAVTKLAHIHFAAAEPYRQRIIQMGEMPGRVFTVGAPGIDNISDLDLPSREDWMASIKFDISGRNNFVLATYHPATLEDRDPAEGVGEMLSAIDDHPSLGVLITGVNADPGHDRVAATVARWVDANHDRVVLRQSLGQRRYLAAMRDCLAVIGNSSSGIVEAPAMGVPTINIGSRQMGRLRAPSIVDCIEESAVISAALTKVTTQTFQDKASERRDLPYGQPGASKQIVETLRDICLDGILKKQFHDFNDKVHNG